MVANWLTIIWIVAQLISEHCWHDFNFQGFDLTPDGINKVVNGQLSLSSEMIGETSEVSRQFSRNTLYLHLLRGFRYEYQETTNSITEFPQAIFRWREDSWGMEFSRAWNLLNHCRMHRGLKPYECLMCSQRFTQKGNLKKHIKTHILSDVDDRKRFSCSQCGKKYTERYNYRVRSFHITIWWWVFTTSLICIWVNQKFQFIW